MSKSKHTKIHASTVFMSLAFLLCLTFIAGSLEARDFDFKLSHKGGSVLSVFPGAQADFYIDFKNIGTSEDSYKFYCNLTKTTANWFVQGCFDFKGVCWGNETMNPETFASGAGEEVHAQITTPQTPGTIDGYLKVVSQTTGTSKIVFFTVTTETSPAIRTLIYTNKDHYMVGDNLTLNLRTVNIGNNQSADTYLAVLNGPMAFFFKKGSGSLELSEEVAPYTSNMMYFSGAVSDEEILSIPLTSSLGVNSLIFASVMANAGTADILSEISVSVVTFE
jgi:hypothetical protein